MDVEKTWSSLDDKALIKDVAMKGKFISNAIKYLAERNKTSIEAAKELFLDEVSQYVNSLVKGKQLHRASRVLTNVQLDEFHYLYDCYQVCCCSVIPLSHCRSFLHFLSTGRRRRGCEISNKRATAQSEP